MWAAVYENRLGIKFRIIIEIQSGVSFLLWPQVLIIKSINCFFLYSWLWRLFSAHNPGAKHNVYRLHLGGVCFSLMVVTLSNTLNMDNLETKALNIIMRLEKRKEVQKIAAYILTNAVKYRLILKKSPEDKKSRKRLVYKIKKYMKDFRIANFSWRSSLRGPLISMKNWPWILIFLRNNIKDLHEDHKKIFRLNEEIAKKLCVSLGEPEEELTKWFFYQFSFFF